MTPQRLKVAICDCLLAINDEIDPVTREKWGPIIPPTAIDWIGDLLVSAVLAEDSLAAAVDRLAAPGPKEATP